MADNRSQGDSPRGRRAPASGTARKSSWRARDDARRARATVPVSALVGDVWGRIISNATPEQLARMRAADRARAVYTAWNAVCSGTREGEHVTGLRFLSDQNKLLVYLDDAAWTQEFTMLREIIRARMERAGVSIDGFVFRTSKAGFKRDVPSQPVRSAPPHRDHPVQPAPLTEDEERSLDAAVAGIDDPRLRTSLKSAMRASLEWKKGRGAQNGS